jgi:AraC-like DNA-binding protein
MESSNPSSSCHLAPTISDEQFIPVHFFSRLVAGSIIIYDANKEYRLQAGDYLFGKRNHLARYVKYPPENGEFKATTIWFRQDALKKFSHEYSYTGDAFVNKDAVIKLTSNPLFDSFLQSIQPYLDLKGAEQVHFLALKEKEIILILLKTNPALKNVLFDFSDPGKIDLESFMNRNFRFNVSMQRFSYLTGRSLTTFKRDFEKIFHMPPGRWLLEKRLQEAHFLMEKKGRKPSDVYLEAGFEDLSHFSYAFKKMYGITPNQLKSERT